MSDRASVVKYEQRQSREYEFSAICINEDVTEFSGGYFSISVSCSSEVNG